MVAFLIKCLVIEKETKSMVADGDSLWVTGEGGFLVVGCFNDLQ